jgi:hypothetical protein
MLEQRERARAGIERSGAGCGRGLRVGDEGRNLSVRPWQGGEPDRGVHPGGHVAQKEALAHRAFSVVCAREGGAMQGPRQHAF